jgi:hypothetical protein
MLRGKRLKKQAGISGRIESAFGFSLSAFPRILPQRVYSLMRIAGLKMIR